MNYCKECLRSMEEGGDSETEEGRRESRLRGESILPKSKR